MPEPYLAFTSSAPASTGCTAAGGSLALAARPADGRRGHAPRVGGLNRASPAEKGGRVLIYFFCFKEFENPKMSNKAVSRRSPAAPRRFCPAIAQRAQGLWADDRQCSRARKERSREKWRVAVQVPKYSEFSSAALAIAPPQPTLAIARVSHLGRRAPLQLLARGEEAARGESRPGRDNDRPPETTLDARA